VENIEKTITAQIIEGEYRDSQLRVVFSKKKDKLLTWQDVKVFLNEEPLTNVKSLEIRVDAGSIPTIHLVLLPT